MRPDGRRPTDLRPIRIVRGYTEQAPGSVLIEAGRTRVFVTATVEERQPPHLLNTVQGWVTAEYSMLPGSTPERKQREASRGRLEGRTQEIARLIGRAVRAAVDLNALGPRTIWIDADVLQADGGTRTLSITGAYVALVDAVRSLHRQGKLDALPKLTPVAAVSVGVVEGKVLLDLNYAEDAAAEVDMNVVMVQGGRLIEVQGTAEHRPFDEATLLQMLRVARSGIRKLMVMQKKALSGKPA